MTFRDYYTSITDTTVAANAITNGTTAGTINQACNSLIEAIQMGFSWNDSPEGPEYWLEVANSLI